MSSKRFVAILLYLLPISLLAQNKPVKPLDHKKWQELVKEVNSKRYDRIEKETEYQSPEQEYRDYERELYGDDEYSDGDGNGSGGGNGSGSGSYSSSEDQGIYDGSSSDDNSFFDEKNDRNGDGSGQGGTGDGDSDVDPKYGDDQQGHNEQYSTDPQERTEQRQIVYNDTPKTKPETRDAKSAGGGDSTWLIIIMIVLVAAAVIYMIIVAFSDKNKKVKAVLETDESKMENLTITKSELELALEAALANKNYREAVRIYFIAIIKEMKDRSWIKWEKKKTNYHYINEINGRQQQPDFITATRAFEIVWYGNRSLDEKDYQRLEPHFKKLLQSIHA